MRHLFDKGSHQPPLIASSSIEVAILANRALVTGGQSPFPHAKNGSCGASCDARADVPSTEVSGATCVQKLDGSRDSAIYTKYRISIRS
ncbi:hypothetical protein Scep_024040 [Stephania cephalantha]|uniref:Uncharacterized protein n=1 Tax=Stephania cephalantha TaxID=152367 RepID=A0AAP0EYK5_9MAGN